MSVVVLAGAGLSVPAGLPVARELLPLVVDDLEGEEAGLFQRVQTQLELFASAHSLPPPILEDVGDALDLLASTGLGVRPWLHVSSLGSLQALDSLGEQIAESVTRHLAPTQPLDYLEPLTHYAADRRLTIVTLNYDLVVESWAAATDIPIERGLIKGADGAEKFVYWSDNVAFGETPGFELLKLHGSIDWWEYNVSFAAAGSLLYAIHNTDVNPYWDYKARSRRMIMGGPKMSAEGLYPHLWHRAYDAISNTEVLVIAGYSLADWHINELVTRFIKHRNTPRRSLRVLERREELEHWWWRLRCPDDYTGFYAGEITPDALEAALFADDSDLPTVDDAITAGA